MNINTTKLRGLLLCLLLPCAATPAWADSEADLRSFAGHEAIRTHLEALQEIADNNGGNRAVGTSGDQDTRDYIAGVLTEAGLNVQRLPVVFEYFHETAPAILEKLSPLPVNAYVEGDPGAPGAQFHIVQNSGSGEITANLQAVDIMIPPGATANSSTSGCEAADFASFTRGNIALIQRGGCLFAPKVDNAIAAGAVGVILFNEGQSGRTVLIGALLHAPVDIPVVFAEFAVGKELYDLSWQGSVQVHMETSAELIHTETENIIAEINEHQSKNIVMAGAHLDSVEEGPGINDNGSGVATLLAIAQGVQELQINPRDIIRFAFWAAEEAGQEGSTQYVNSLSKQQANKIKVYLNADMLGSLNFVPSVYDADASDLPFILPSPPAVHGSTEIEQVLMDYFNSVGPSPKLLAIDGRSDYRPFLNAGIPFGAITSGFDGNKTEAEKASFGGTVGAPYDACYHKTCDTIVNVSDDSLDLMSGAIVHTIMTFAKE